MDIHRSSNREGIRGTAVRWGAIISSIRCGALRRGGCWFGRRRTEMSGVGRRLDVFELRWGVYHEVMMDYARLCLWLGWVYVSICWYADARMEMGEMIRWKER